MDHEFCVVAILRTLKYLKCTLKSIDRLIAEGWTVQVLDTVELVTIASFLPAKLRSKGIIMKRTLNNIWEVITRHGFITLLNIAAITHSVWPIDSVLGSTESQGATLS